MRIAYLILAHNNPRHLGRLIDALHSPAAQFFVHVDRTTDIAPFLHLQGPQVVFCERRIHCAWGNRSLVDATNVLIDQALAATMPFDYHVLLSGACYPIRSTRYIETFLAEHAATEFIETIVMPDARYGKPIERLTRYFITREKPFARLKWKLQSLLHATLPQRNYRRYFGDLQPVGGSQWWALTHDALVHARRFIDEHAALYAFFKHVDCPDELVFQTALWNSPFRERLSHSLTFTHWLPSKMGPETIDQRFLATFSASPVLDSEQNNSPHPKQEVLFARKFTDRSADIVGRIDEIRRTVGDEAIPGARAGLSTGTAL